MKFCHPLLILLAFALSIDVTNAQSSISLSAGVSKDIDNSTISFYQIPLSVIWKPGKKNFSPLVEANYSFGLAANSTANAYTLNPGLPAKVSLQERIKPDFYAVGMGFSIRLLKTKSNSRLNLNLIVFGICHQNIQVSYKNYDKENYEVLNPDVTLNDNTFFAATSLVYNFHRIKKDWMLMLHIQSALENNDGGYRLSYNPITPLQLTFGYNFYYQ